MSKEHAADYFSRHTSDECHITSDNRVFHNAGAAQSFASSLKDQIITAYKRSEFVEAAKTLKIEDFEGFNDKTDYAAAKALVKKLGLKPASQKQEDVFKALNEAIANIEVNE